MTLPAREDILKPEKEVLQALIKENISDDISKQEFRKHLYTGIIHQLLKEPLRYRTYGAFWWFMKADMRSRELGRLAPLFGKTRNRHWEEAMRCGTPTMTLMAAYLYEGERISASVWGNEHRIELVDGSFHTFVSSDPDMEALHIANQAFGRRK